MTSSAGWIETDGVLTRQFELTNFVDAFGFVTQVALIAQRHDHHPDISISWNKVTISTTSHDAGNAITDRDHRLTEAIDKLL
jgi:4a-hydroxytetrahydrobiopterin dehydratase